MAAFAVFWILLLIGVPIFGVLLGTSLTGLALYSSANLLVIPQQFYNGVNQQTLLAIREKYGKDAVLKAMSLQDGATARTRFLDFRSQSGAVIAEVTEISLRYLLRSTASAPMTLSPVWYLTTDSGSYLVNCADGSVSRE